MISGEFGVLLTNVTLPEKLVPEVGVKPTVKADVPPGGTEIGSVSPESTKPAPPR